MTTNKEKFEKVFGVEADTSHCPIGCSLSCPFYDHSACESEWWYAEYKKPQKEIK